MFEEYLQDSYEFLILAKRATEDHDDRQAKRYYRASVFYASGAIEAFVNYIADSFAKAGSLSEFETAFLNDETIVFSVNKGVVHRSDYHSLEDKLRLLIRRFVPDFSFNSTAWSGLMEFKKLRDSLVHPRCSEDETGIAEYQLKVSKGLSTVIEVMNSISRGIFGKPLRRHLLDLIPE